MDPCLNKFEINTRHPETNNNRTIGSEDCFIDGGFEDGLGRNIFHCTELNNKPGLYVEDSNRKFMLLQNNAPAKRCLAASIPEAKTRRLNELCRQGKLSIVKPRCRGIALDVYKKFWIIIMLNQSTSTPKVVCSSHRHLLHLKAR